MTRPLPPPPRKDPQKVTRQPTRPPEARSRAALGLSAAAAEGRFALQQCADCGAVQYPPRDACHACLGDDLRWEKQPRGGQLIAETTVRTSTKLYFRERTPWRMGTVRMDAGPVVLAHVHGDCPRGGRVRLDLRLDRAGQGVLIALPEQDTPFMEDDPEMRELSAHPRHRRVLITDARHPATPAIARALLEAGAAMLFIGEAETWRPWPGGAELEALERTTLLPLDVTDTLSVQELAGEIAGKTDILVNTARFIRPGGPMARSDVAFARDEIETNYLGLMRLAQAFGPTMKARAADGVNSAVAWVNLLPVHALSADPAYGCFTASAAAAHNLSQSLRAEFRGAGIRVMNLFHGPTEEDWYQPVPPPKVQPAAIARDLVDGLVRGLEDVWCGDVAKDLRERFRRDPRILERESTLAGDGP